MAHALGLGRGGQKVGTYVFSKCEQAIIDAAMDECRGFLHRTATQAWRERRKTQGKFKIGNEEKEKNNEENDNEKCRKLMEEKISLLVKEVELLKKKLED
jgi:hypothetical protein